jgi:hypothetical protein
VTSASHDLALAWHPVLSSSSLLSSLYRRTYTPNTADSAPRTPATGRDRLCLTREEIDSFRGSPNRHSLTAVQQESLKRIVLHSEFLVRVWIIADYLLIPRLQNLAIDEVGEIHAKRLFVSSSTLNILYNELPRVAGL